MWKCRDIVDIVISYLPYDCNLRLINKITNSIYNIYFNGPIAKITDIENKITGIRLNYINNYNTILSKRNKATLDIVRLDICNNPYINNYYISNLINLTELNISGCKVGSFNKLTNLVKLSCDYSLRDNLIDKLHNLTYLSSNTTSCSITDNCIKNMTKLVHLNCGGNKRLTDMSLSLLTNLVYLDCGCNNQFTDRSIMCLTQLTYLNCGKNTKITTNFSKLKTLKCGKNKNFLFTYTSNLTHLDCGHNNKILNDLKFKTNDLSKIDTLILNKSNKTNLFHFKNLTHLEYNGSSISENALTELTKLTYLNCSNYKNSLDLTNNTNLTYLDCLCSGVKNIKHLTNLKTLSFSTENINSQEIIPLTNLKSLSCVIFKFNINKNNDCILDGIKCLTNLTRLNVIGKIDKNVLDSLPNLEYLCYTSGILRLNTDDILKLKNLKRINGCIRSDNITGLLELFKNRNIEYNDCNV
jgi:hypothetical protein